MSDNFLSRFQGGSPASVESIRQCEAKLDWQLPADYVRLMRQMNGGEGFIGAHYLWPIEDVIKMNTDTYFADAAPGLLVFGSEGGGEAFGFDMRTSSPSIVAAPYIGMAWDTAIKIAPSFDSFLQHLYRSEDLF